MRVSPPKPRASVYLYNEVLSNDQAEGQTIEISHITQNVNIESYVPLIYFLPGAIPNPTEIE